MRKLILLLIPTFSYGQYNSIPTREAETIYVDTVFKIDLVEKQELYSRAKIWVSDYFKSSKAVIDMDDKEIGILIGKGGSPITVETAIGQPFNTNCFFTFKLSFKDSKVKVEVYDFFYKVDHAYYEGNTLIPEAITYPKTWFLPSIGKKMVKTCTGYRDETLKVINILFNSLEKGMKTPIVNNDW